MKEKRYRAVHRKAGKSLTCIILSWLYKMSMAEWQLFDPGFPESIEIQVVKDTLRPQILKLSKTDFA
jgi:hypothetical protein